MPRLTNRHHADLILPDGTTVRRGASLDVSAETWARARHRDVVQAWVSAGILEVEGEDPPPPADGLAALRAEADGLGVRVDGRWGEARLREEIEKAGGGSE